MDAENQINEANGQWMSIPDAQAYCGGVSRSTIQRLLRKKAIRGTRIGARTLVHRPSLDEYLLTNGYDSRVTPVRGGDENRGVEDKSDRRAG